MYTSGPSPCKRLHAITLGMRMQGSEGDGTSPSRSQTHITSHVPQRAGSESESDSESRLSEEETAGASSSRGSTLCAYEFTRNQERSFTIFMDSLRDTSGATCMMGAANLMSVISLVATSGVRNTKCATCYPADQVLPACATVVSVAYTYRLTLPGCAGQCCRWLHQQSILPLHVERTGFSMHARPRNPCSSSAHFTRHDTCSSTRRTLQPA